MDTLLKIILNLGLGAIIFYAGFQYASNHKSELETVSNAPDYTEYINGEWAPVEIAKGNLSFQYGVLHHHTRAEFGGGYVDREYPFSVKTNHLLLENRYPGIHGYEKVLDLPMKIYEESGFTYLEISDVPGFYGKYKKIK